MTTPATPSGERPFDPQPVTLRGEHALLEPLTLAHAEALFEAGRDAAIWRYLPITPQRAVAETRAWIEQALAAAAGGTMLPFAIREAGGAGRAVGSTRYLDIRRADRGLEIGFTWIGTAWQRTAVNTECKLLLLRHAFETLGAVRVQFKTDARNTNSQRAIARLGAVREGVLRRTMRLPDGFVRDSVYFSILDDEWPEVKRRLTRLLQRDPTTPEAP